MREPDSPLDLDETVIPALLDACPSFVETWEMHVAEWARDDAHERGAYIDFGVLADHLVGLLERGETGEFPAIFDTVENLLRDGDGGVVSLVKVGLLEDLGNIASNRHGWSFAAQFRGWFGPASIDAWDDIHRWWGTSDSA